MRNIVRKVVCPASGPDSPRSHRYADSPLFPWVKKEFPSYGSIMARGYQVYSVQRENEYTLLLAGGDKSSQDVDILRANALAREL